MAQRIFIFLFSALILLIAGCGDDNAHVAMVVGRDERLENALLRARPVVPPKKQAPAVTAARRDFPVSWYPRKAVEKKWKAIVIHHSAVGSGNMRSIDSAHKHNGWDGVGYDFVIGNGRGSGSGQVEVTYRWRNQKVGAHCKSTNNWANIDGVGICLIGDFTKTVPTGGQMQSLAKLVSFLQLRYRIPDSYIYGHDDTPNHTTATLCPGPKFPWGTFRRMVAAQKNKMSAFAAGPVKNNNL